MSASDCRKMADERCMAIAAIWRLSLQEGSVLMPVLLAMLRCWEARQRGAPPPCTDAAS